MRAKPVLDTTKPLIILVAYYFPPGDQIGGQRPYRFFKYLRRMGYECRVITASEQSDEAIPEVTWIPDSLANVWDRCGGTAELSFVGKIERLARGLFFPGHYGLAWSLEVASYCTRTLRAHPGRKAVLFTTFPPLGALVAGLLVRWRTGVPWISDFRDPLAAAAMRTQISRWHYLWNQVLERMVFRAANCIIANTGASAAYMAKRCPDEAEKLRSIWNGFDPEDRPRARALPDNNERVIVHAGTLYLGRNPNVIIESMIRLMQSGSEQIRRTRLVMLGSIQVQHAGINHETYERGEREGWLRLVPPVSRAKAQQITEEASGLLLVQPQSKVQVPGKLFEYICIGRPILALVPRESVVEDILRKAGVRYVCIYTDDEPATVDRKMLEFFSLPPTAAHYTEWFENSFNAEQQTQYLTAIIEAVAAGNGDLPKDTITECHAQMVR